jgi:formiminoglutamase
VQEFLEPIKDASLERREGSLGKAIDGYYTDLPDWENASIALVGVPDGRGSSRNSSCSKGPDHVRRELYLLANPSDRVKIVDLGNIKIGSTFNDTDFALTEICRILKAENIIPIVLGGSVQLTYGQYRAFETISKSVECSLVGPRLHLSRGGFLSKICLHEPNFLFNVNALAYQSHYMDRKEIQALEGMYFSHIRLGLLRSKMEEIEPILRNTDIFSFDIGAIKQADAPGNEQNNPSGLTSEEACQLCWYAGISDKVRSFGIYEVNPEFDYRNQSSKLASQMVWYFLEGYANRKGDHPELHEEFLKYRCHISERDPDIIFYKSKRTGRWWMEIPHKRSFGDTESNMRIPCTYADYQTATKGEMPNRFFSALQKLHK